jgi:hypothetical protein
MKTTSIKYEIFPEEIMEINERLTIEQANAWLLNNEKEILDHIHYYAMEQLELLLDCADEME